MKYIMIKNKHHELPIVFPDAITHLKLAKKLCIDVYQGVISAGFITIQKNGEAYCYGQSTTLRIGSREIDSEIVNKWFTAHE